MKKKAYPLLILIALSISAFAQTGSLSGIISDKVTGEKVPFANVILETPKRQ